MSFSQLARIQEPQAPAHGPAALPRPRLAPLAVAGAGAGARANRRLVWALAALVVLLLALAAARPLSVPDEGRYAEISRWMLVSGDWLVPRLDGLPFFHKPPLTHWLQALSMMAWGVSPWAARIPEVLLALLLVGGTYAAVRRGLGVALAERAALMLAASIALLLGGTFVNHDIGVAAWIATAIWCFALALTHSGAPHRGWALAGFATCALGVLTKGLIGVVVPGLVMLAWVTWTRQWRRVWRLPWATGLGLFALLAVPWFAVIGLRYPGALDYLFIDQQFTRYLATTFNNGEPWWFYLPVAALLLAPWSLFAGAEALGVLRRQHRGGRAAHLWRSLCWIWLAVVTLFFSIPHSKLVGYILPAMPPIAVLAALGWQRVMARRRHARRWFWGLAAIPLGLVTIGTVLATSIEPNAPSRGIARELACRMLPGDTVLAAGRYPLDLPFVARLREPVVVIRNWPQLRRNAPDNLARQLFEAGDFAPELAHQWLKTAPFMAQAAHRPGYWLVTPRGQAAAGVTVPAGWRPVAESRHWLLYRSSAPGDVDDAGWGCGGGRSDGGWNRLP